MAKIIERRLLVRFSKIAKDTDGSAEIIDPELLLNLEQVIQEIVGDSVIVELDIE